jgi:tetratricopeptide (TPR) repeat protein
MFKRRITMKFIQTMAKPVLHLSLSCVIAAAMQPFLFAADSQPDATPNSTVQQVTPPSSQVVKPKTTFTMEADTEALQLTDDINTAKAQLEKHPDDPEAHFLMAAAYSRSPYLEEAFKEIKKTKNLLKEKKDFEFIDRTIHDYEGLLQSAPHNEVILYRLSMAYYFKAYSLEKYPQHYKNMPTGNASDFYQKARDAMSQVLALNPKDYWAKNYMGFLVSDNGKDLTKAIPIWKESLQIDKDHNPAAYLLLGQAYLQQGDVTNAMIYGAKGIAVQQAMGMTLP